MSEGKINIYEANGTIIKQAIVTANAKHEQELMKSDFVSLEWKDSEYIILPVGAYIKPFGDGENDPRYTLFDAYKPNNNGGVYEYKPKFEAPQMILAHTPCLFATENAQGDPVLQTDWVYTGSINLIVGRLKTIIEEQTGNYLEPHIIIKTTTSLPASATCSFSGVDILSALNEVCNQFGGLEWHIEWGNGRTGGHLWIGNVLIGNETIEPSEDGVEHINMATLTPKASLVEGGNVQTASRNENKEKFANYFIVRGGTRNITIETPSGNNVQTDTRLTIDDIDTRTDKVREPKIQRVLIFDDVYPKLDLYAYNIRKRTRRLKDDEGHYIPKSYNQDGSVKEYKKYSIYYMRLAYFTNEQKTEYDDFLIDPQKDIVNGKKLMCSFEPNEEGTHSALAGREFELIYHSVYQKIVPNPSIEDTGIEVFEGDYEIVYEQDDDFIIPNDDTLEPWGEDDEPTEQCDMVVLVNIVMGKTYLNSAKTELASVANKEIERIQSDNNNYTVKSNAIAFDANNPNLSIGDYVSFTTQNGDIADSRILKLVTNIDYPIQQEITIGNAVIKGSTQSLTEDVKYLSAAIDINETSATTINKMISQLYRLMREYDTIFLHKNNNDETPFTLGANALNVENQAILGSLQVLADAIMKGNLETEDYNKDMAVGTGWGVDHAGNMQVESLEVRSALRVLELVYNRLSAEESDYIFTEAGTIKSVTSTSTANQYTLVMEKRNETDFHAFHVGDILKGVVNDLTNLGGGSYYTCWLEVVGTDTSIDQETSIRNNSITVKMCANIDCPSGTNYPPKEHMVVHRWGNNLGATAQNHALYPSVVVINSDGTYTNRRQSCWYISSTEKRIMYLDHVFRPKINEGNYAAFFGLPLNISSFKGHSLDETQPYLYCRGAFLQDIHFINYLGKEYKVERDRGEWSAETAASQDDPYIVDYATYQTVTWNNCKWECVSQTPATHEPPYTGEWKLLKENVIPSVYTLITNVKTVIRDSEGVPNVDVVKCLVRKTQDDETTNDTQNQLGYLYYSVNGENMRRGNEVEIEANDGIKKIRFVFYPKKTEKLGGTRFGSGKFGTSMIEAVVDVIDGARRGAILRGPSEWKDNVEYMGGGEGEEYQDIVVRTVNGVSEFFLCHFTHTGVDPNDPNHQATSGWDINAPWEMSQASDFVATKVLFAERSIINNLALNEAAAYPRVSDGHGGYTDQLDTTANPTVSIDGNTGLITANGGSFNNVTVNDATINRVTANNGTFNNITVNKNSVFYGIVKASVIQTEVCKMWDGTTWHDFDFVNDPHTTYDTTYPLQTGGTPPEGHLPDASLWEGLEIELRGYSLNPLVLTPSAQINGNIQVYYKERNLTVSAIVTYGYVKLKAINGVWVVLNTAGRFAVINNNEVRYVTETNIRTVDADFDSSVNVTLFDDVFIDASTSGEMEFILPSAYDLIKCKFRILPRTGRQFSYSSSTSQIKAFDNAIVNAGQIIRRGRGIELFSDGTIWHELYFSN